MCLLIENPFSRALFQCESEETTLKRDVIIGNLGEKSFKILVSNELVSVSISKLHKIFETTGK